VGLFFSIHRAEEEEGGHYLEPITYYCDCCTHFNSKVILSNLAAGTTNSYDDYYYYYYFYSSHHPLHYAILDGLDDVDDVLDRGGAPPPTRDNTEAPLWEEGGEDRVWGSSNRR